MPTVFAVLEHYFEYNDNYYDVRGTSEVKKVYRTREEAELAARKLFDESLKDIGLSRLIR